jgi:hypothetical protein
MTTQNREVHSLEEYKIENEKLEEFIDQIEGAVPKENGLNIYAPGFWPAYAKFMQPLVAQYMKEYSQDKRSSLESRCFSGGSMLHDNRNHAVKIIGRGLFKLLVKRNYLEESECSLFFPAMPCYDIGSGKHMSGVDLQTNEKALQLQKSALIRLLAHPNSKEINSVMQEFVSFSKGYVFDSRLRGISDEDPDVFQSCALDLGAEKYKEVCQSADEYLDSYKQYSPGLSLAMHIFPKVKSNFHGLERIQENISMLRENIRKQR